MDAWVGKILWKEMATHFSILAWEIPWTEEPGGLQSMGSQRSRTQSSNSTAARVLRMPYRLDTRGPSFFSVHDLVSFVSLCSSRCHDMYFPNNYYKIETERSNDSKRVHDPPVVS